jgi:hypothetical protein
MDGNELWVSDSLDGTPSGNPVISSDGSWVFLTHNAMDGTTGYFTVLDANNTGAVFYSEPSPDTAFGPPGIFHSPVEGNYDSYDGSAVSAGTNNVNDMLMWSQTPKPTDANIQNGFMYGFQFPRDFDATNSSSIGFWELGNFERDFQSITAPVITNQGLSAYWSVSRSAFQAWTGKEFSRARSWAAGFTRSTEFAGQPVYATPALSNDGADPILFCGTASPEFVRMNADFTAQVVVPTTSLIMSKALIDSEERAVYFVETDGILHQVSFTDITDIWTYPINFAVEGEIAITPKNDVVIVADTRGVITGIQVAEITGTDSPSAFPSDMPSMAPSGDGPLDTTPEAPVAAPVDTPTSPVEAPTTADATEAPGAATPAPPSAASQPTMVLALVATIACLWI